MKKMLIDFWIGLVSDIRLTKRILSRKIMASPIIFYWNLNTSCVIAKENYSNVEKVSFFRPNLNKV